MDPNAFNDKTVEPNDIILGDVLGPTAEVWQALKTHINDEYDDIHEQWKFYYQKYGWILQVMRKKRTLFWMKVFHGHFTVTFWFGDKAVAVVEDSDLPEDIKESLRNAKKHQIGRSVQVDVRRNEDITNVKKLIAIKLKN